MIKILFGTLVIALVCCVNYHQAKKEEHSDILQKVINMFSGKYVAGTRGRMTKTIKTKINEQ